MHTVRGLEARPMVELFVVFLIGILDPEEKLYKGKVANHGNRCCKAKTYIILERVAKLYMEK